MISNYMYSASYLCPTLLYSSQTAQSSDISNDATVVTSNRSRDKVELAMLDSGTMDHFITLHSKCTNVRLMEKPNHSENPSQ